MLTDRKLAEMAADKGKNITTALLEFYEERSRFSGEEQLVTTGLLIELGKRMLDLQEFEAVIVLSESAVKLMETEEMKDKKALREKLDARVEWAQFNLLAQKADATALRKDYRLAAQQYKEAFAMDLIKGTHMVRVRSVPVLAQAGETDLAFKQLELLANTFELGGNGSIKDNPLCDPLKKDARWEKYMNKLEKNGAKYR
ncbi:hypothetical protein D3C86_1320650 [compost metagenome]